jgi:hypothetical protein
MRKAWESLQFRWHNYINNGIETNISDVWLGFEKNILDKRSLSLLGGVSDLLKEHEQRKKNIERLVKRFKSVGKKRFSRMKGESLFS